MKTAEEIKNELAQCIGTMKYYRHCTGFLKYTDGVHVLAESADCYWLIDAIASYRRTELFQVWKLEVTFGEAVLTMKEDSDCSLLVEQKIVYTDFPLDEITLWLIDGVLILPSEY